MAMYVLVNTSLVEKTVWVLKQMNGTEKVI